jgi:hypothetical protein
VDVLRELVLPRLDKVRPAAGGYTARCPAHADTNPSLSVSAGKDHPVVLHCQAGCAAEDVLAALGLAWGDLLAPKETPKGEWTPAGPATAVYDYTDEQGNLLFQVLRTAGKQFRQRVPDVNSESGWTWRLGDVRRVLYRLPAVLKAVADGHMIYICEGEKDVHTLVGHGLEATCNPGGAGKWRAEYAEHFCDAVVTIVADRDDPGQAHARRVWDCLEPVAACVSIVEALEGKDATDHVNAGHTLDKLVVTRTNDRPSVAPDLAPDLWQFLATPDDEYDWIVPHLLERGDRLMLTGFEGLGKSMLVRQFAVAIAAGLHPFGLQGIDPRRVLLIDCENSERQSRRQFRRLADAVTRQGFRIEQGWLRLIHKPAGLDLTHPDDEAWLIERVTAHRPDVLFIGPFYRLHNANLNEELPARRTVAALDRARTLAGCALVIEAHAGHGEVGIKRSVRPTGSSLLLRWPEFGYGLAPAVDPAPGEPARHVKVLPWRGPRDERRWPTHLSWGGALPWRVTREDEMAELS